MIKRFLKAATSRRALTLARWKMVGPNLAEIGHVSRIAERRLGFVSMTRGVQRLHEQYKRRGTSFGTLGKATTMRSIASRARVFHGNQYVKLGRIMGSARPTVRLARRGFRGGAGKLFRRVF